MAQGDVTGTVRPGRSFGGAAEAYDRARPGARADVLDWLLTGTEHRVLDLGAGTGQVAGALAARPGLVVTAVEPDPGMRAVLRERAPAATVLGGTAEAVPLADASVDAVLVGSAWHWFDVPAALAEAARVLRDGGVLGVFGTAPDIDVAWVRDLFTAPHAAGIERGRRCYHDVPVPPEFEPPEYAAFVTEHPTAVADLVRSFTTHSAYRTADPATRAAMLDRARAALDRHFPGATGVDYPALTEAWRARRAPR